MASATWARRAWASSSHPTRATRSVCASGWTTPTPRRLSSFCAHSRLFFVPLPKDLSLEGSAKQVELQISCELCGSIFDVNGSRYLSFREKGRDVYCPRCEDRLRQEVPKKVKCDRCHKPFTYPASWYLYKGMKEPTTCSRGSEQSVGVYFGEQTFRQRAANFIRAYFNLLPRE
mmetsp:Transcript_4450/g.11723  ORF Transcript_4450/g.11723 Transcript_4450/m.11723 type:complete len:174 (-) Transcript_4450:253-774(-)